MVPPYCGVPRLSHQFPVLVVVAETVVAVDVVDIGADVEVVVVIAVDVVAVLVEVVGVTVVDVVVELLHDASNNDITRRKDNDAKIIPFFI
jgi:hypothetical protein